MLIVFSGLPGSGKTSLAQGLARALEAHHVRIDSIEEALLKRYPRMRFVSYTKFGNTNDPLHEPEVIKDLPAKLKNYRCDAVISGNGM